MTGEQSERGTDFCAKLFTMEAQSQTCKMWARANYVNENVPVSSTAFKRTAMSLVGVSDIRQCDFLQMSTCRGPFQSSSPHAVRVSGLVHDPGQRVHGRYHGTPAVCCLGLTALAQQRKEAMAALSPPPPLLLLAKRYLT